MHPALLVFIIFIMLAPGAVFGDESCYSCHGSKGMRGFVDKKAFAESAHGIFECTKCHLSMTSYPHGSVARVNCGICHFLGRDGAPREEAQQYKLSVHGRVTPVGKNVVPACQTCHGSHYIYPAGDSRSTTGRRKIPALCSQCHPREAEAYTKSIHGAALLERGSKKAPTCFDCHLEHLIPPTGDARWMLALVKQCGNCHKEQMATYRKTYHGKVTQLGYATMAKCSDCHGSHAIARVADKASPLSADNILATCRKCHPAATRGFTAFYAHPDEANRAKYPVMFYTFVFMTTLLIGVFAFFFTHTFLWAFRALKERIRWKGGE